MLNQTSRAGLAGVVADRLRAKGWNVSVVGNFHGVVPATTVYYPPGQEDAARVAADDLPWLRAPCRASATCPPPG